MEETKFHKIHCTYCGKTVSADQLAVNLDLIICDYLKNRVSRMGEASLKELLELFQLIKTGIYLSKFDMINKEGILSEHDELKITSGYVLKFLERKHRVTLFDSENKVNNDGLKTLYNRIQFYRRTDVNSGFVRVKRLVELLNKNREAILADYTCQFRIGKDDQENEFISQVITSSLDGPGHVYQHMVCPKCGNKFYITAGTYEEKVIVLLGSSRVGKTAYLAALVSKINGYLDQKLGREKRFITVTSIRDERYAAFNEKILRDYSVGRKPEKTDVEERLENPIPLISLQVKTREKTTVYTIVDMPGEVFVPQNNGSGEEADGDFIINRRKICYSADAFWFCIDPAQIDRRLRKENEQSPAEDKVQCNIDMVLNNIENMVRIMGENEDKTKIPSAIIFTKSDLLQRIAEGMYQADDAKVCLTENGCLDADAVKEASRNIINYLEKTPGIVEDISDQIGNIFENKNYFSIAAYGVKVDQEERPIAPYGIALPFLWTMASFGDLSIERKRVEVKQSFLKKLCGKPGDVIVSYVNCGMTDLYQ